MNVQNQQLEQQIEAPACPYCSRTSSLVRGERLYPHRNDLRAKRFYLCEPCWAYVGCHPGTARPLGRLADGKLRAAKQAAHKAFDALWQSRHVERSEAYGRLARELQLPHEQTHIGMFDVDQCLRVVQIVKSGALLKASNSEAHV